MKTIKVFFAVILFALFSLTIAAQKKQSKVKPSPKKNAPKIVETNDESKLAMLALTAYQKGEYKTAKIYLTKILEITPDAVSYSLRATINGIEGNTRGEIDDYFQALSLTYEDTEALWQGGFAFNSKRNAESTIAAITIFLKTNPKNAEAFAIRGWAYRVKGNIDSKITEAVADFSKAVELKPNEPLFYYLRGEAELHQNNPKNAINDLTKFLEVKPDNETVIQLRANARMRADDLRGAVADFDELVKRNPNSVPHLMRRARALSETENYEKAIEDYDSALKIRPKDDFIMSMRAGTYEQWRKYEQAISDYSDLIKRNPKEFSYYYRRADCYKKLNNKEKALEDYRQLLKIDPNSEIIKENIAELEKDN